MQTKQLDAIRGLLKRVGKLGSTSGTSGVFSEGESEHETHWEGRGESSFDLMDMEGKVQLLYQTFCSVLSRLQTRVKCEMPGTAKMFNFLKSRGIKVA